MLRSRRRLLARSRPPLPLPCPRRGRLPLRALPPLRASGRFAARSPGPPPLPAPTDRESRGPFRFLLNRNRQSKTAKCDVSHIFPLIPAILLPQRQDEEVRPYPSREAPNGEFGVSGFFRQHRNRT